jgi:hypothetical protein
MRGLPPWYGTLTTPARWGNAPIREGRTWAMDNGVFTGAFDPERFVRTLDRLTEYRSTCAFVAAPDVIGNADATLAAWPDWSRTIHALGYPTALVAQDGLTPERIPTDADALFIGGTDAWRDGPAVPALVRAAHARGLWVHVGRVNSLKRLRRFALLGAHSADGTHSAFAGVPATVRLFDLVLGQTPLWNAREPAPAAAAGG